MSQPAIVTQLRPAGEIETGDVLATLPTLIHFWRVPKIPKYSTILEHFGEDYLPESWDGDLNGIRTIPITPGPDGQAGKTFAALHKAGELNLTANTIDYLLAVSFPEKFMGKIFLLTGTRYATRKNGIEFVLAISTLGGVVKEIQVSERDRIGQDTYALVLKD